MWSELAPEAGMLSGGRGEGLGSRSGFQGGMPAHLHPCMLRILLLQRGARRVDPPAPAVLPVCSEEGLRGWGALAALQGEIWGPSRSCPACPELVSRGLLATGWPVRLGAVVRLPGNRKGQRCPRPVQGPRPCSAPLCVFHNSPLIFLTFPGHPRSSHGPDGSLGGCWLSPSKLGLGRAD